MPNKYKNKIYSEKLKNFETALLNRQKKRKSCVNSVFILKQNSRYITQMNTK